jgi:hypothetical protein
MDEGGKDDEGERGERHETSGPARAKGDLDVSASGLLSLGCSRGIARGLRNARTSDGHARAPGTLVATQSTGLI